MRNIKLYLKSLWEVLAEIFGKTAIVNVAFVTVFIASLVMYENFEWFRTLMDLFAITVLLLLLFILFVVVPIMILGEAWKRYREKKE